MVNRMGQSILMDIRRRVFNHIQHMSMKTLDHFSSGRLITRATNDVETLNELFSDVLVNLFKDVFMLLGIVVMMLWMNWRLALVAFAVVPLIALITILVRGRLRRQLCAAQGADRADQRLLLREHVGHAPGADLPQGKGEARGV